MTGTPLWTSEEAHAATGGQGPAGWAAQGVSIDTRTLMPGDLFVALMGDSRDGHAFVPDALKRGAAAALVSQDVPSAAPLLRVADTLQGLRDLGIAARARTRAKIVAVTGSVGKTSTKEALRHVLAAMGETHASAASYNNHWGVPLTLARMAPTARYGVFEIGMNHAGEIAPLARMVAPNVAVITTVEPVHLAHFSSVRAIAEEKGEIFAGLTLDGTAVINRDNPYYTLLRQKAEAYGARHVLGFGAHSEADSRLLDYIPSETNSKITALICGRPLACVVGSPGRHMALNALAVLAAVHALGGDVDRAAHALADLAPPKGRGVRSRITLPGGAAVLIDESYNANPASMRAALSLLGATAPGPGGRRIAVLGDMLELGDDAPAYHAGLAESVAQEHVDLVFTAGPLMEHLHQALPASRRGAHAVQSSEIADLLPRALKSGDVVMVKGSFGSRMGLVVDCLKTLASQETPPGTPN